MIRQPNLFEIIREHRFEDHFKEISAEYPRADDIEANIDWALARNPYYFPRIGDTDYHLWKTGDLGAQFPKIVVLYKIETSKNRVILIDVF